MCITWVVAPNDKALHSSQLAQGICLVSEELLCAAIGGVTLRETSRWFVARAKCPVQRKNVHFHDTIHAAGS